MKRQPTIAIVGRPNVGKSAIFNKVCKKRIAIVDEAEGITRDRLYDETELFGRPFRVIDTGGIDAHSPLPFNDEVKRQAEIAIEEADALIMVVDAHIGPTTLDEELTAMLHRTGKPLTLAVNKVDDTKHDLLIHDFYSLGIEDIVAVSAMHNRNIAEMLEVSLGKIPLEESSEEKETGIKVAILGRPNVGKSSLINYLLDENRCIVSPVPGTTRDSIDVTVTFNEKKYTFIDTAGIRRKGGEHEVVDKFAAIRTERAITRADVCLLLVDSRQGMSTQDRRIAHMLEEEGKGCIILFNKWDLVKGFRMEHCLKDIEEDITFLKHCPKLFISALKGRNVTKIFDQIDLVHTETYRRISTGQLNKTITEAMQNYHPPMIQGKRLRVYYMTQADVAPPRFIMFVNYPDLMTLSYKKYLYNQLREKYPFTGAPLHIFLKAKKRTPMGQRRPKSLEEKALEEEL